MSETTVYQGLVRAWRYVTAPRLSLLEAIIALSIAYALRGVP